VTFTPLTVSRQQIVRSYGKDCGERFLRGSGENFYDIKRLHERDRKYSFISTAAPPGTEEDRDASREALGWLAGGMAPPRKAAVRGGCATGGFGVGLLGPGDSWRDDGRGAAGCRCALSWRAPRACPPPFRGRRVGDLLFDRRRLVCASARRPPPDLSPETTRGEENFESGGVLDARVAQDVLVPSSPGTGEDRPPEAVRRGRTGTPPPANRIGAPRDARRGRPGLPRPVGVVSPPGCFGGGTGAWCAPGWGPAGAARRHGNSFTTRNCAVA
jgi:hypothetical protein